VAKTSGVIHPDPFNEVDNKDPNKPDSMGDDLYYNGWDEIMKMHLQETGDMVSTPNSDSGKDMMGHEAPGEPSAIKSMGGGKK
jgi:hypothetical protein